jgi:hypothetical protein
VLKKVADLSALSDARVFYLNPGPKLDIIARLL